MKIWSADTSEQIQKYNQMLMDFQEQNNHEFTYFDGVGFPLLIHTKNAIAYFIGEEQPVIAGFISGKKYDCNDSYSLATDLLDHLGALKTSTNANVNAEKLANHPSFKKFSNDCTGYRISLIETVEHSKGIGSSLIQHICQKYDHVNLSVNSARAYKFYLKNGFEDTGLYCGKSHLMVWNR